MKPFTDVHAAIDFVKSFVGNACELRLPIADSMNDAIGVKMALLTHQVLLREWEPDGYEQMDGYRVYKYKEWAKQAGSARPRPSPYRWRTALRRYLPWFLLDLGIAGKGRDCEAAGAEHSWYNRDENSSACYHCNVVRPGRLWK